MLARWEESASRHTDKWTDESIESDRDIWNDMKAINGAIRITFDNLGICGPTFIKALHPSCEVVRWFRLVPRWCLGERR